MSQSPGFLKSIGFYLARPLVRLVARTGIPPTIITLLGFLLAVGAAVLVGRGNFIIAGVVLLVAGLCDIIDGALARYTQQTSIFGAVLDSTLDRSSEVALLLGISIWYGGQQELRWVLLAGLALMGSLLVSYIRARAEAMGLACQVGWFTRAERVLVLSLGLLLGRFPYALVITLAIITVFSFVTVGQRLFCVWQQTRIKRS
ncbi:MAG: CDP-alcohol phosphatidyltransferase family protein [Chloroflexota bacterium]